MVGWVAHIYTGEEMLCVMSRGPHWFLRKLIKDGSYFEIPLGHRTVYVWLLSEGPGWWKNTCGSR